MISLETIIVISLLLYLVQKISLFIISWIKGFYLVSSLVFLVNSYLDSGISVNTEFSEFKMTTKGNKLIIEVKEGSIEDVKDKIEEILEKRKGKYQLNVTNNKVEITSN